MSEAFYPASVVSGGQTGADRGGLIAAAILVVAFPIVAGAAGASEFDRAMEPVLAEYLKIQTALAADLNALET